MGVHRIRLCTLDPSQRSLRKSQPHPPGRCASLLRIASAHDPGFLGQAFQIKGAPLPFCVPLFFASIFALLECFDLRELALIPVLSSNG